MAADKYDQPFAFASSIPSQLLAVEVLRRPLESTQSIFIAGVYSGEYDLTLKSFALERRTFKIWEKGELKPYRLPPKP